VKGNRAVPLYYHQVCHLAAGDDIDRRNPKSIKHIDDLAMANVTLSIVSRAPEAAAC